MNAMEITVFKITSQWMGNINDLSPFIKHSKHSLILCAIKIIWIALYTSNQKDNITIQISFNVKH